MAQKSQVKSAMARDAIARRDFLWSTREAEFREAVARASNKYSRREFIATTREEVAGVTAARAPPPNPLPHTDDIVIEPGK